MSARTRSPIAHGIEAVCFDCWGTLLIEIDRDRVHARRVEVLRACAHDHGARVDEHAARTALDRAWHRHWELWDCGSPSGAIDIARDALEALEVDAAGADTELVERLSKTVRGDEVRALPGAQRTLESLRGAGLRLALVCDTGFTTGEGVRRLLDAQGLLVFLEVQAFSDETGVSKPHPRIFHHALSGIESEPTRAMHVGDLRRTDVAGARALGMKTIRIRGAHDDESDHPEADHVVDSHDDLGELFGIGRGASEETT